MTINADARMAENIRLFDGLIDEASRDVDRLRFRSAAVTLQTAARFASCNHPGVYRSIKLESLAVEIGQHLGAPKPRRRGSRIDVLHVLTQAYSSGGHTRLAWRWIENDNTRVHSVVLTEQQGLPVPNELRQAVARSGGCIISLGAASNNLLTRAKQLRRIASDEVGVVVLHIHPRDVIPLIALSKIPVQVVYLNHADHVFWIGGAITNVLADIRPAGRSLSLSRRHFSEQNSVILPIPLRVPPKSDKHRARALLGLPQDDVVILSIASSYKYAARRDCHFIDIHKDFVMNNPKIHLIVVGPKSKGRWQAVGEETGERFRAVGTVIDLDAYYDAADIYVDSLPFGSLTSFIDAGVRGLPVLGLHETNTHSVLTSNDISLAAGMEQYSSRDEYIHELEALATRPDYRGQASVSVQDAISRDHLSPGWNRHLEHLFDVLESDCKVHRPRPPVPPETILHKPDQVERALIDLLDASGFSVPLWKCRLKDAPFRPALDRARYVWAAPNGQRAKSLVYLLPDVLLSRARSGWLALRRHH